MACHFILEEGTLVYILIGPSILSLALHDSFIHFTLIDVAIFEVVLPCSMFFAITCLPFIYAIIILNTFLQKLKSTGHPLLTKNLSRQVIELPQYNFIRPLCNLLCRNIRKLSIGKQDIKFFDCYGAVFIHFELLYSLDPLIDVFLPCQDLCHCFLNLIYVVGLMVNLTQRFDVILSFLNQQSVTTLGICFEVVYSSVDSHLQICTDPLDQLIQFYQIIKLPQLLLDNKMLWSGGPVIHFPQIFLLQLFERNQVVFALLMSELSQANRTKQRRLLTSRTQTDHFDLLIFVLLVHAGQLGFNAEFG